MPPRVYRNGGLMKTLHWAVIIRKLYEPPNMSLLLKLLCPMAYTRCTGKQPGFVQRMGLALWERMGPGSCPCLGPV